MGQWVEAVGEAVGYKILFVNRGLLRSLSLYKSDI